MGRGNASISGFEKRDNMEETFVHAVWARELGNEGWGIGK